MKEMEIFKGGIVDLERKTGSKYEYLDGIVEATAVDRLDLMGDIRSQLYGLDADGAVLYSFTHVGNTWHKGVQRACFYASAYPVKRV